MKGIGADRLLQPGLLFAIVLALFQPEAAIASLAPVDFFGQAVPVDSICKVTPYSG